MANEFDIDALLDQALGNIHPDANKGNDDKSVSENETVSTVSNVETAAPVLNPNNDLQSGELRQSSDRASTKSKLQELRTEIANASKSFNFDDTLNAAFSEKSNTQPNSDRVFDIGDSQGNIISNGQSPDIKKIDVPNPVVQEDWTNNFNPEDIVNNFNQPKLAVQDLNGSQDAFVSNNGNQGNSNNGNTAEIIGAPELKAFSDNGSKVELKHESIESALDNVLGVSENSVLQAENSTQENVAIVSSDVDIDKLLAAEFDEDFSASFASAPPPGSPKMTTRLKSDFRMYSQNERHQRLFGP